MGKHPSREADAEHLQAAFTAISPFSRMPDDVTVPRVGAAVAGAIRRGLPVTLTDIAWDGPSSGDTFLIPPAASPAVLSAALTLVEAYIGFPGNIVATIRTARRLVCLYITAEDAATSLKAARLVAARRPLFRLPVGPPIFRATPELAETERPEFLVDGFLVRRQLTLVAAPPKDGKSTFLRAMVVDMLTCNFFLERIGHLHADDDILWLSEEPRDVFFETLFREFECLPQVARRLHTAFLFDCMGPPPWGPYTAALAAVYGARQRRIGRRLGLIIVDTLSAWRGLDLEEEMRLGPGDFLPLRALANATGAAVVVAHHTRKAGGNLIASIRGSTNITAAVDNIVGLERKAKPRQRRIQALGRLGAMNWSKTIQLDDHHYNIVSTDDEETAAAPTAEQRRALEALTEVKDVGLSRAELALKLGLSDDGIKRIVPELKSALWVRAVSGPRRKEQVFITEAGVQVLGTSTSA